ncbi:MAG TPA: ribonuclease HII [Bacteriovoracaceae bacterium]|nr:ribonuclease HII [Bacteriovoracaceae bacterium]
MISWKGLELSFVTWDMDHNVIDAENIFEASMRGMKEAALFLSSGDKSQTSVLIDGHIKLRWKEESSPWTEFAIIKGDVKSSLIGLASIIAKEKRDEWMREMHLKWPQYGFETNVGYPTKFHREAIREHGPCPIHRKSFNKVKEFIRTDSVG